MLTTLATIADITTLLNACLQLCEKGKGVLSNEVGNLQIEFPGKDEKDELDSRDEFSIILEVSQNAALKVDAYQRAHNMKCTNILVKYRDGRNKIPFDKPDEWELFIRQVYTLIDDLRGKSNIRRINLYMAVPIALAFGLGYALKPLDGLCIYAYNTAKTIKDDDDKYYYLVLNPNPYSYSEKV